ncbi:MAG: hypothetical protein JST84_32715 [Acidobacteria bacterium]|nr:hypothetical protein [Acidobacteriota bacterium]
MRKIVYCLLVCLLGTTAARAQAVEGDWEGTLKAGAAEFRLAVHIKKNEKGGLQATLDSVDQGAMGIPLSSISLSEGALKFTLDSIGASYEGKLDANRNVIGGNWSQGGASLPLEFTRPKPRAETKPRTPKPSDIDGNWEGALNAGGQTLRIALHITNFEDGVSAKFDSLDQNLKNIPVTTVQRDGTKLKFELRQFAATFEGTIDKELKTITGEWSQGGGSLPLILKRTTAGDKK